MPSPSSNPDLASLPPSGPADCFALHRGRVYRWAAAHGLHHHQRLDVTQETFARLVAASPRFSCEAAQLAWLRRVASNLSIDHLRQTQRRRTVHATTHIPAPRHDHSLIDELLGAGNAASPAHALGQALASLSEMQRLVLLAKCVDSCTFAQIAAQLGIAIPTAKTHYLRGLQSLRSHLLPRSHSPQGVSP